MVLLCSARTVSAYDAVATWSAVSGAAGYKLYVRQGTAPYGTGIDVGTGTPDATGALTAIATGLSMNVMNYFAVTSYNSSRTESAFSNELSLDVTGTPAPTATATLPVGGGCANVTVIPPGGGVFTGTTSGASTLVGSCAATNTSPERVFQWTPSVSGIAMIDTCSTTATTFDTVVYMRTGSCSTGTQLACNDDTTGCGTTTDLTNPHRGSMIRPTVTAGQTYYIVVDGWYGSSGSFSLTVIPPAATAPALTPTPTRSIPTRTPTATPTRIPPTPTATVSGACGHAISIPSGGGVFTGTTSGSSTLQGTCASSNSAPEQVFKWIPAVSGVATIHTCNAAATTFDTVVYMRGGSCTTGTQLACNDDTLGCGTTTDLSNPHRGSKITPTVTAGQIYYIVVDGYSTSTGSFSLTVIPPGSAPVAPTATATRLLPSATPSPTSTPQSSTGGCSQITVVPSSGGVFPGSTSGLSTLQGTCAATNTAPEKVFQWTPSVSGVATIDTCSGSQTTFDTVVYLRGASCSGGTELACNDDTAGCGTTTDPTNPHRGSMIQPTVTAGQMYYIVVDGYGGNSGNFLLTITPPAAPTGGCADVTVIPSSGGAFSGTTSGTSTLIGSCAATDHSPEQVFQWTPSRSGVATIDTCSPTQTTFDTVIYLRGGACSSGTELACNDDTAGCGTTTDPSDPHRGSMIQPAVTAGQTYYIVVDGWSGASGNFDLTVTPP